MITWANAYDGALSNFAVNVDAKAAPIIAATVAAVRKDEVK